MVEGGLTDEHVHGEDGEAADGGAGDGVGGHGDFLDYPAAVEPGAGEEVVDGGPVVVEDVGFLGFAELLDVGKGVSNMVSDELISNLHHMTYGCFSNHRLGGLEQEFLVFCLGG